MRDEDGYQSLLRRLWREAWRRPRGRWPAARWGLGLLVPIAIVLWGFSILLAPDEPDLLRITVESQATGMPIEAASVIVGSARFLTDASGMITIDPVPAGTDVVVSAAGHESAKAETGEADEVAMTVSLSAVLVIGSVSDIVSGVPVVGAELVVLDAGGEEVTMTRTDESGTFVFKFIPEDAEIVVTHGVYGEYRQALEDRRSLQIQLQPPVVTGRVIDASGQPVAGATISSSHLTSVTDGDGVFTMEGVGQGMEIEIVSEGVVERTFIVDGSELGTIRLSEDPATPEASPAAGED